ncbi:FcoT family thioesterase [Nocardia sp. NBC_01499]|uniref:FcoT family thioesterase n=1 Tax=Nocardia sp. NBC_01499 TaxID=2903597 RepID=UPI003864B6B9
MSNETGGGSWRDHRQPCEVRHEPGVPTEIVPMAAEFVSVSESSLVTREHFPHDEQLMADVLRCYKPHCRYLRRLAVDTEGLRVTGTGMFEIPESCYIDATGHLNAVEMNICYNQIMYQTFAVLVRHEVGQYFGTWTMDDYWERQLPDILITRFNSTFHRPIHPLRFHGEFTLSAVEERFRSDDRAPFTALDTTFRCWDDLGGQCAASVRLAIVSPRRRLEPVT